MIVPRYAFRATVSEDPFGCQQYVVVITHMGTKMLATLSRHRPPSFPIPTPSCDAANRQPRQGQVPPAFGDWTGYGKLARPPTEQKVGAGLLEQPDPGERIGEANGTRPVLSHTCGHGRSGADQPFPCAGQPDGANPCRPRYRPPTLPSR